MKKIFLVLVGLTLAMHSFAQLDAINIQAAVEAYKNKDYQISLDKLNEVSDKGRRSELFLYYKGYSHYYLKQYDSAEVYLKKYLLIKTDDDEAVKTLGDIEYQKEKLKRENDEAIKRVEQREAQRKAREDADRKAQEEANKRASEQAEQDRRMQAARNEQQAKSAAIQAEQGKQVLLYNNDLDGGIFLGLGLSQNPDISPCNNTLYIDAFVPFSIINDHCLLDINFAWDKGLGSNQTWLTNAFGKNASNFTSFGSGGSVLSLMIDISPIILKKPRFCTTIGPEIGIGMIALPQVSITDTSSSSYDYSPSIPFSLAYGFNWQLLIGHRFIMKLEYVKYTISSISTTYNLNTIKEVDVNYEEIKIGLGYAF